LGTAAAERKVNEALNSYLDRSAAIESFLQ